MPIVRKLAPEEIQTIEGKGKGPRKAVEEQYDRFLADYDVGDYAEAILDPGEKRLTVRNRFKAAADRRGLSLHFPRTTGDVIRFKVVSGEPAGAVEPAPVAIPEPEPAPVSSDSPPKRGPGRPRKTST